jgi:hypothetical protein
VIPAAILLVIAAVAFDMGMHVPLYQTLVAVVGVPLFLLWLVRMLVRSGQAAISRPAARPVRGVIVHRPDVYRIPRQEAQTLPAARLRALHGGRDETAS